MYKKIFVIQKRIDYNRISCHFYLNVKNKVCLASCTNYMLVIYRCSSVRKRGRINNGNCGNQEVLGKSGLWQEEQISIRI